MYNRQERRFWPFGRDDIPEPIRPTVGSVKHDFEDLRGRLSSKLSLHTRELDRLFKRRVALIRSIQANVNTIKTSNDLSERISASSALTSLKNECAVLDQNVGVLTNHIKTFGRMNVNITVAINTLEKAALTKDLTSAYGGIVNDFREMIKDVGTDVTNLQSVNTALGDLSVRMDDMTDSMNGNIGMNVGDDTFSVILHNIEQETQSAGLGIEMLTSKQNEWIWTNGAAPRNAVYPAMDHTGIHAHIDSGDSSSGGHHRPASAPAQIHRDSMEITQGKDTDPMHKLKELTTKLKAALK